MTALDKLDRPLWVDKRPPREAEAIGGLSGQPVHG